MEDSTETLIKYAAYPRGPKRYGSAEALQIWADAHFGLNTAGLIAFMFGLAVPVFADALGRASIILMVLCIIVGGLGTGFAAHWALQKARTAYNWRPLTPIVLSIIIGVLSPFCLGFFVLALLQTGTTHELRKYGLGKSFFGTTREHIKEKVRELEEPVIEALPNYGLEEPQPGA